ncbi:hypothetical protein QFZ62_003047 [Clavibacter sp. B3I6]|nr:hypothetical protein [Clavibacter sp. B3I6]
MSSDDLPAGVRVPHDRHRRHGVPVAIGALGVAGRLHPGDLLPELGHARVDAAAVELDLRLTGSAGSHAGTRAADLASGLARHRVAPSAEARQEVLQLCELDLGLALAALGVLAEDVEDHGRAVDDLDLHHVLEGAPLAGRELGVGDDGVRADRRHEGTQLLRLAAAEVGAGVRGGTALEEAVEHHGARRLGQGRELAHAVLGVVDRPLRVDADEDDVLEAQLPVLDLGDVLELG